ncbi:hypothetical protein [Enhygromyxa salina]|uniref:Uncharacterized protein n=1 Tax=Enhygromyxa salina TaxID=215803 RepID=A0A2S9YTB9_9BACT|nr:hypothetical protein [Enhygromyxa salina]PRQ08336.1 hypothetical protein ENSA7_19630 [Enhygromyxa salina]
MAEPSVPSGEVSGPTEAQRNAIGVRVLVIIGVVLTVLMAVFGRATSKGYDQFTAYQKATLEDPNNPPQWHVEGLDVDGCVDASLAWIEACPGVSSWCESSLPDVMNQCLDTRDRTAYCDSVGDAVRSTRFGFEECSARYDQIEGRYARRYAKKHCSLIFRVIAGYCAPTGG